MIRQKTDTDHILTIAPQAALAPMSGNSGQSMTEQIAKESAMQGMSHEV
jgi:hypothetical protein